MAQFDTEEDEFVALDTGSDENGIPLAVVMDTTSNVAAVKNDHISVNREKNVAQGKPIISLASFSWKGYVNTLGGMSFKDVYQLPNTPASKNYQRVIGDAVKILSKQAWDIKALTDPKARWVVGLSDNEGKNVIKPCNHVVDASDKVQGEPALLRVQKRLGIGGSKSINLDDSGFFVTIIPSKSPELAGMMIEMLSKGEDIGFRTGGVAYDLGSTFTEQEIMSHIFSNIRGSTLKGVSIDEVRNHITIMDYRRLIIGQLLATYPRGIIYDQPCIANHNKCQHVTSGKLNHNNVLRINEMQYSEEQYKHMARARNGVTLEDVKRYRSLNLTSTATYRIKGNEDDEDQINVTFTIPYLVAAHTAYTDTVDYISQLLPKALTENSTGKARTQFLSNQISAVPILSQIAWISELSVGKEGISEVDTFSDTENIRGLLEEIADDDEFGEVTEAFIEAYSDFMLKNDTTMVLRRNEPCENCGGLVADHEGKALQYIPLEAESLFLAVTQYRLIGTGRIRQYVI